MWRPLYHAVRDRPLALCDGSTINPNDLVAGKIIRGDDPRETYYLMHEKEQKWYYLSEQTPEEVALFKIFDSDTQTAATCRFHGIMTLTKATVAKNDGRLPSHFLRA